jgi:hypothetical protein
MEKSVVFIKHGNEKELEIEIDVDNAKVLDLKKKICEKRGHDLEGVCGILNLKL